MQRSPLARAIHAALLGGGVVLAGPVRAQPTFTEQPPISITAGNAQQVFAADVDGDGDVDVLSASFADDRIAWYENDGGQSFSLHTITTAALSARSVYAADLDGDGDMDVLSASSADNKIAWYENDGQSFTLHSISITAAGARSVFAADVDGDGHVDVLSASALDDRIAWYRNDGAADPDFDPQPNISNGANFARSVFAADIDGDGDTDALSASQIDNEISWYENIGAPSFSKHTISTTADQTQAVAAADLDGDGDIDVLSANGGTDDLIAWYENDGSQNFSEQLVGAGAGNAQSVTTADVDRDGDVDVLSASFSDNKIAWYENDGLADPSFTPHTISTAASGAYSVFAADVDGDGDLDALSASFTDDTIAWYRNDRIIDTTPFSTQLTISTENTNAEKVFSADLDGDGDPDLVSGGNILAWHENDGNENFAIHTIASTTAVRSVYADDVDRDGDLDLVSASIGGVPDKIAWHENNGLNDPTFTLRTITENAIGPRWARSADLDGDGDVDVASASYTDDKIAWHENDGSENFTEHTLVSGNAGGANGANSVEVADLDGDGDPDLLTGAYFDGVAWFENDGMADPAFAINTVVAGKRVTSVAFGDIDGDGDIDLASASQLDDTIAWYENDGMADPTFTLHTITTLADGARGVVVGDLDRDGDVDLASVSRTDATVAWYENDGDQSFTAHTLSTAALDARGISVADLDRDGDTDLLSASLGDEKIAWYENLLPHREAAFLSPTTVENTGARVATGDVDSDGDIDILSATSFNLSITWSRNDGDGTFTTVVIDDTPAVRARAVATHDVDSDGDADVLAAVDDRIMWYENNGSEAFTPITVTSTAMSARSVAAGDIDGDGDLDLASASYDDDKVAWYENDDGVPTFTLHTVAIVNRAPQSVAVADVDNDGHLDLFSAQIFGGLVNWYENDGAGNFITRQVTNQAAGAWSVASGDVDRDGDTDVLAAASFDDKVAWYENEGVSPFTEHTISTSPDAARSVAVADLDGDGDPDVLSASAYDDEIAWHENDGAEAFSTHILSTNVSFTESVAGADMDADGDVDVVSGSVDRVELFENCGGNFSVEATDVAPSTLGNGQSGALLKLRVANHGQNGDDAVQLASLAFRFEDSFGSALSTPQFSLLVDQLDIYRDDGDGSFDSALDVLVDTVPGGVNLSDGVQVLGFGDGDAEARIAAGAPQDYFLAVTLTDNAAQQVQTQVRAVHLGTGADRPKASSDMLDLARTASCAADVASSVVTAIPPGITVDPVAGVLSTEAPGMSEFFRVVLDTEPVANVTVGVSSSDLTEGTVDQAALTFTPGNWSVPQTVFVTGVDDALADGDVDYSIVLDPAVSADPAYNGIDPPDVAVTNIDDEPPTELIFADGFEN